MNIAPEEMPREIARLEEENERLNTELELYKDNQEHLNDLLEKKDNIIKEVREYMDKHEIEEVYIDCKLYETQVYKDILDILKGE